MLAGLWGSGGPTSPFTPQQVGSGNRMIISTIAGGGFSMGSPATSALMSQPTGVALDPKGRGYFVLDEREGSGMVRFVNTTTTTQTIARVSVEAGGINLVAGGGTGGESLPAREVDLGLVTGLAVDPTGDAVYILTPLTSSIRVLNVGTETLNMQRQTVPPGRVATIVTGIGSEARSLAVDAQRQVFYTAVAVGQFTRVVCMVDLRAESPTEAVFAGGGNATAGPGDEPQAVGARLINPLGVATDRDGNLYIAEAGDARTNPGRIRRVDSGRNIATIATGLDFPVGVGVGPAGQIYAVLSASQQIVRVSGYGTGSGSVTVVAGRSSEQSCDQAATPTCGDGGSALLAYLNIPGSTQLRNVTIAVDDSGIYLPDDDYRRVRYINVSGTSISIAGVAIGAGTINTIAGNGQARPFDNLPASLSELQRPTGLAADINGNLFISDTSATPVNLIRFFNRGRVPVTLFGGTDWQVTVQPGHITSLNHSVRGERKDNRITTATFLAPGGLAATPNGLFIVDSQYGAFIRPAGSLSGRRSGHIRFLNTGSTPVTLFPKGGVHSIVVPPGEIRDVVGRNDSPGVNMTGDGGPADEAVIFPSDIALDDVGNLFIADQGHNLIRVVDHQTGIIDSVRGGIGVTSTEPLVTNSATGIAVVGGRLYVADTRNDRILRQDTAGGRAFTIIANSGSGVLRPRDVAVDMAGNVLVVNNGNHRVLRVVAPLDRIGTVTTLVGTGSPGYSGDGGRGALAQVNLVNPGVASNEVQYTNNILVLADNTIALADSNNNRIRLLVPEPNLAPRLTPLAGITVAEGSPIAFTVSASDPNGDQLTLSLNNPPGFVSLIDNGNGTATISVNPGYTHAGTYTLNITASDGELSDSARVTLIVEETNRSPVIVVNPIPGIQEALSALGREVTISGRVSDPDGDDLAIQWYNGATLIGTTAEVRVTLGLGNHSIFLRATDSRGLSANSQSQSVSIVDTTPPVIVRIPEGVTAEAADREGAMVAYTLPAAVDLVDGEVAVSVDRPSGSLFPIGTTAVSATAVDSRGNRATATFPVTVTPPGGGASDYTIKTYAGNGASGSAGNGGPALAASFRQVVGLSYDTGGNLIFADLTSRNVRRVDKGTGAISILAGNGTTGNGGDAGPALFATFGQPGGIAADTRGNIYVSDTLHHRVRRISSDGRIHHFAGSTTGAAGSAGDGGPAAAARLRGPTALMVDAADNLYIADTGNNRVRVISALTGMIANYAGSGGGGFGGDGGQAILATLNGPAGLAFDQAGNLYIADRSNNRVRRVEAATRVISTAAGSGVSGFAGDGGSSAQARLDGPVDVAVDSAGNLLIADQNNHRIRLVGISGLISTIAGDGAIGYGGDGGLATMAKLNQPRAVSVLPDGYVYVADGGNFRIRRLEPNTPVAANKPPVITSLITDQVLTVGQVTELAVNATDADGDNVVFTLVNAPTYVTVIKPDPAQRSAVVRFAPETTGSSTGIRLRAEDSRGGVTVSAPFGITVNAAATTNRPPTVDPGALPATIEAVSPNGAPLAVAGSGADPDGDALSFVWTVGGLAVASSAQAVINLPLGSHLLVLTVTDTRGASASSSPRTVEVRDTTPPVISNLPAAITTSSSSSSGAKVDYVMPTAMDLVDGLVPVTADRASGSLFPVGTTVVNVAARDARGNTATASFTVTVSSASGSGGYAISTFAGTGGTGSGGNQGPATSATFRQIVATGYDSDGNFILADLQSRNFRRIHRSTGLISILAGNGVAGNTGDGGPATFATFGQPAGVASDSKGNIYVSDALHHRVRRIAADGRIYHFAGSVTGLSGSIGDNGPAIAARLNGPTFLAVDAQDNLYIADTNNSRIRVVSAGTGIITTFAGTGGGGFAGDGGPASQSTLNGPGGLAFDSGGSLYIADSRNHRVRRIDAVTKVISTIAGAGSAGYSGDSLAATSAQLNQPNDVAIDPDGNLVIADLGNHRIRLVDSTGRIGTIAGDGVAGYAGDGGSSLLARLSSPRTVDATPGESALLVADAGNFRIRRLAPNIAATVNHPPVITSVIGDRTMSIGETVDLPLTATDEDNDSVTFELINGPAFASIVDSNSAQRVSVLRLSPTAAGTATLRIQATDSRGAVAISNPFIITVADSPTLTSITSISTSSGRRGTTVNTYVTGSGFATDAVVSLSGTGIVATTSFISPTRLNVRIMILTNATPSVRDLQLRHGDGTEVTRRNAFTVIR